MGLLVDGKWHETWYETGKNHSHFQREAAKLRYFITQDGRAGPSGDSGF